MSYIPRLFVDLQLEINGEIKIEDKKYHYLVHVMRCGKGDNIILINGKDGEFLSEIIFLNNKYLLLKVIMKQRDYYSQKFLGLIIPPVQKLDIILKSATEIGMTDLYFIQTKYTNGKVKENQIFGNIIEAVEQSERLDVPNIHNIKSLNVVLDELYCDSNLIFFCEERTGENKLKQVINSIDVEKNIFIIIGPEGGFSNDEKKLIKSYNNVISISLGNNILRTETAAIASLSILKYMC